MANSRLCKKTKTTVFCTCCSVFSNDKRLQTVAKSVAICFVVVFQLTSSAARLKPL